MLISCILLFIAGVLNASMDTVSFHFNNSVFNGLNNNYFNPEISWRNKYKNLDPKQGPKFFMSTTSFVLFTDFWHLAKTLMLACFILACVFYNGNNLMLDAIILYSSYSIPFNLFYSYLFLVD